VPGSTVSRRLFRLIWPLLAAMVLLLLVAALGMQVLSVIRAYIAGESHWSKAQKNAVFHLEKFASVGNESEYQAYRANIAVNLGDRRARLAMVGTQVDAEAARLGLLEGRNHPDDVGSMVAFFPLFRFDPDVARAIDAWTRADALLMQIDALALDLHKEVRTRGAGTPRTYDFALAIVALGDRLTPLSEEYSNALSVAARRTTWIIELIGAGLALVLAAGAILLSRRTLARLQLAESQQREAEQRLAQLAQFDALTGLANRSLFHDRLVQAIARAHRSERRLALLFLDLDRFKEINDSLGHEAGDRVLQEAGARLRRSLREGDSVARLGGDEFTAILEDVEGAEQLRGVAKKLQRAFAEPMAFEGRDLFVTLSIGIALYPRDGDDAESLLKHADTAMYKAKSEGRDTFQFYAAAMSAAAHERLTIEGSLRQALERGEFVLHYQPVVRLASGEISSVEALVRWRHPEEGLVLPGRFIGPAEQNGLIVPIGAWVLQEACAQAARWQAAGLRPLRVAVNLSARQFRKPGLVDTIQQALRAAALHPQWLTLEITESLLMENPAAGGAVLEALRALGASMALDDFGTGYSPLAYLKHFPLDVIKIDRSFVRDIPADADDAAIVKATIGLASSLGMLTTAEGVETPEQLAFLQEQGCRYGQGFLFSPALEPDALAAMLREERILGRAT
jgi:diguanylate cyclase (GGDEF)-like protein